MKKILATLLALSLTFGSLALPATESGISFGDGFSASAETYGYFEYKILEDGNTKITDYSGNDENVVIPDIIDGKKVTSIGDSAFYECTGLTSITIPDTVTSIGNNAFCDCHSLKSIIIPDSVTSIGDSAFYNCYRLESIMIPDSVTSIGDNAFTECKDLTSITLGSGVNNIAKDAFYACASLTSITVDSKNTYYSSENGVLFDKNKSTLLIYPEGKSQKEYTIPYGVTSIDYGAFSYRTKLASIVIPNSFTSINDYAFYDCRNITNITIPSSVTSIGKSAFSKCYKLANIDIPNSVISIGDSAFYDCHNLKSIIIPDSVTSIGDSTFSECSSLTSITIPDSVTSIGDSTFSECSSLTSITIPDSVTSIGDSTFSECSSLTSITIPDSVTSIGDSTFSECSSLTSITIPDSVTSIGNYTFYKCKSLISITIPNGVMSIGNKAFSECTGITSITIPNSIVSIGNSAFEFCSNLTDITILDGVISIGDCAFWGCSNLTSITIPNSVTSIDDSTFSNCENLRNIIVDSGNKYFSSENGVLFNKNKSTLLIYPEGKSQKEYTIPYGVTIIDYGAFYRCTKLTSIIIPNSVTSIGNSVFMECTNLTSITISKSVTSIDDSAFFGCLSLKDVYYTGSADDWAKIKIDDENEKLTNANIHYNYVLTHTHSYIEEITKQPTCTEEGEKTFTCDCGDTYTETIPAKGHIEVIDKAVAATCTTDGKTEGSHCSVCGEVIKAQTVIKATGHKYNDGKVTKQPTCTETGVKTYTCSECGAAKTETIKANGHTEIIDKAIPATCTTDGKTEGSHCSVCGEVIKAQTVIKATGHNFGSWSTTKSATCTESGTQTRKCATCGKTETKTIPATGHKSSGWIIDKQPAVGVKGSKHKECTVCGKVLETAEIPALSVTDISGASVTLSTTSYTYNGKAKKPAATVTLNGKTLKKDVDYTVKYSSNTAIGKAKITITGKGNYKGTVSKTFKILPAKQTIAKLTAQKKGFALTWTKGKNVTGYQIQYDVKSDFKSAKSTYVKSNSTYKKTISGLKAKKAYYVRVRSYKTVGGVKYYGSWSAVKSVKTK